MNCQFCKGVGCGICRLPAVEPVSILQLREATKLLEKRVRDLEEHNKAGRRELDKLPVVTGLSPGKGDTAKLIDMERFIRGILDPDMYGYAVSREVRNAARRVLGMEAKE